MGWSMQGTARRGAPEPGDGLTGADAAYLVEAEMLCESCGRALDGDPDEDLVGNAGAPICGECARERDFFVLDVADGELDGEIG